MEADGVLLYRSISFCVFSHFASFYLMVLKDSRPLSFTVVNQFDHCQLLSRIFLSVSILISLYSSIS